MIRLVFEWVLIILSGLLIPAGCVAFFRCARITRERNRD